MENNLEIKKLLLEISERKLNKVKLYIESLPKGTLSDKTLISILATLCKFLSKIDVSDKACITELFEVIILCNVNIINPNMSEMDNHLKSMYHLIKFFVNKRTLSDLEKICSFLYPTWISPKNQSKDILNNFTYCTILLNNDILIPHTKTNDIKSMANIFLLCLRLYHYMLPENSKQFFIRIYAYVSMLKKFPEMCLIFSYNVLTLLEDIEELPNNESIHAALKTLCCIIHINISSFEHHNYSIHSPVIQQTFKMLKKLCYKHEMVLCIDIFFTFISLTVRELRCYTDDDLIEFKNLNSKVDQVLMMYGKYVSCVPIIDIFSYISRILQHRLNYYESSEKECWTLAMKPKIQLEYASFFHKVSRILAVDGWDCPEVNKEFNSAILVLYMSGMFYNLSLRYEIPYCQALHEKVMQNLENSCLYIHRLKMNSCEDWKKNWRLVGTLVYNIGCILYNSNMFSNAAHCYSLFCRYIILLEGTTDINICLQNSLGVALQIYSLCYMHRKEYKKSLAYLGLGIQICPKYRHKLWHTWGNVKVKAKEDNVGNISELTVHNILQENVDLIKKIYPSYTYCEGLMEELLLYELEYYAENWSSKIPMNNTVKQLCKICNDPIIRTRALNLSWEKIKSLQDEEFMENLEITIKCLNKRNAKMYTLANQLCLSVLYYIEYKCKYYDILKKNLSDMNEAVIKEEKPTLKPYEEPPNPDDTCDIVPAYHNIKIENNMHLHKLLNKSINIWHTFQLDEIVNVKDLFHQLSIDTIVKETAYECRLQNFSLEMVRVWLFYLKCGKFLNRTDIIVTSVGFLLECSDCKTKMAQDLMKTVTKNSFKELKESPNKDYNESVVIFYTNKSAGYLKSSLIEEGYNALCEAEENMKLLTDVSEISKARIQHLRSLYLVKPCSLNIMDHDTNFLVMMQTAFKTIAEFYKAGGSKCLYTLSFLFEISLSNGWMYYWLRMPREIRCNIAESALLSQQLVLPLRTVQFLALLAFTDLLDSHYDDCQVKLSGIVNILCIGNSSACEKSYSESTETQTILEIDKEFNKLSIGDVHGFETMLDVPVQQRINLVRGSPTLQSKPFKVPAFTYHENTCDCFYCCNIEYQRLILQCTNLEAQLHSFQSNTSCALDFFKGGVPLFHKFKNMIQKSNLNLDLVSQFMKNLDVIYSKLMLDYSYFLCKHFKSDEADRVIGNIMEVLGDDIKSNIYFYNELLMLKLSILTEKDGKYFKYNKKSVDENEFAVDYSIFLSKTPENKISTTKVELTTPGENIPPKKAVKIKFDISSDDEFEDIIEASPEAIVSKMTYFKLKTPGKTPAPNIPKIKIYTPASKCKSNKVIPMCMAVSPKPNSRVSKQESTKSPINPETKVKSKMILEARTKLLTAKLNAEKRTLLKDSNHITTDISAPKIDRNALKENIVPNRKLRKNLMVDLTESDEEGDDSVFKKDNDDAKICSKAVQSGSKGCKKSTKSVVNPIKKTAKKTVVRKAARIYSTSSEETDTVRKTRIKPIEKSSTSSENSGIRRSKRSVKK